ncbi:MAG: transglycosylase SLT domain-containing protein [Bacteroidia bacterium]|nr:transglycosylase SLT domain-containing protein [Bacteroidia bacterium]
MSTYRPRIVKSGAEYYSRHGETTIARPIPENLKRNFRNISLIAGAILLTNLISHTILNPGIHFRGGQEVPIPPTDGPSLYLMDKASMFVSDVSSFEDKVREIAGMLNIPPEWLMAVMYSESKFDATVLNHKGSGATGLIQFMPSAADDLNVSLQRIRKMNHLQQLEYVYLYLEQVRERYGDYESLADLYLAILYPKARKQDYCYTLYAQPGKSYEQNAGLDENKDGSVTVSDIDRRMKRLYPTAYMVELQN